MTLAVAALAVAAIFMSSSAGLLSRFYDKERQFAYAAQSGLDRVVSRLQLDTTFAVDATVPALVLDQTTLADAAGTSLSGVTVRVWAARTGDTTRAGPLTVSLLAQVSDASGTRFVRRTDLRRYHFGQWSLISNDGNAGGNPFINNSFVAGRVHSNENWSTITQVSYRDSATSAGTFSTTNAANLKTGKAENQRRIPWPHTDTLLNRLSAAASTAVDTLAFDLNPSYPSRVELVWRDLDADGVAERGEGFLRIFDLNANWDTDYIDQIEVRPSGLSSSSNGFAAWNDQTIQNQCGAFYRRNGVWQFFPVATHRVAWAWAIIDSTTATPARPAGGNANTSAGVRAILTGPTARCFPSGSPYLVNTERFTNNAGSIGTGSSHNYPFGSQNAAHRYGGQDTTFTATIRQCTINSSGDRCVTGGSADQYTVGSWRVLSTVSGQEYLRRFDKNVAGSVAFFDENIRLSGTAVGRLTIAVEGSVRIVDHLVYAGEPHADPTDCDHLLGVVAQSYVRIEENPIAHRIRVGSSNADAQAVMLGGVNYFPLHGAYLSLESYFGLDGNDFRHSNSNTSDCFGTGVSSGCIRHLGSSAMQDTRSFSTNTGQGRGGRYEVTPDVCMESGGYRPPLFPATNRYKILRRVDVRPSSIIGVNGIADYFATLQGTSDIP